MKKYFLYSEQIYPAKHICIHHTGCKLSCLFWAKLLTFFYPHTNFKLKIK